MVEISIHKRQRQAVFLFADHRTFIFADHRTFISFNINHSYLKPFTLHLFKLLEITKIITLPHFKISYYFDFNYILQFGFLNLFIYLFLLKVNEVFFQYSDGGRRRGLPMAPLSPRDVTSCHVELFTFSRQCSQHC